MDNEISRELLEKIMREYEALNLAPRKALQKGVARYDVPLGWEPEVRHWTEDDRVPRDFGHL